MAGSPEEERTAPEASRSSNAGSSSSSSSSSSSTSSDDGGEPVEHTAGTAGELDGRAPPQGPAAVGGTSAGIVNAREQQCEHKVEEAGRLNIGMSTMLMVAAGVAVAVAAAFLDNKRR